MPVQWLDEPGEERTVGKKASSLTTAAEAGLKVPRGFVVTAQTFEQFVRENGLEDRIQRILNRADRDDLESVRQAENRIRSLLADTELSEEVRETIEEAYEKINMSEEVRSASEEAVDLVGGQRETEFVAVRSSPTGTRIPGVHHTELNVNGKDAVVTAVKECWASLYAAEALSMEEHVGDLHSMAVIVQRMAEADVSGVAYGSDPVGGSDRLVEAVWGLGTALSDGTTTPDRYLVDDRGTVAGKEIANKGWKIVRDPTSGKTMKQRVSGNKRQSGTLDDDDLAGVMDALDTAERRLGGDVKLSFACTRNGVHVLDVERFERVHADGRETEGVVRGRGAAPGEATGQVNIIYSDTDVDTVQDADIVASTEASERLIPVLQRVSGIVSDEGGVSSNLSALARTLDVPCVVGTENATDMLTKGETVTVDGGAGIVAEGAADDTPVDEPVETGGAGDRLTATRVKSLNTVSPAAEGAVIPDYVNPRRAEQVAQEHHPETVWVRTEPRDYAQDNLGVLSDGSGATAGDGVILASYGTVMKTSAFRENGVDFLGIDVAALEQDGGREALLNAVEKIGREAGDAETAILLEETDPAYIRKAVESGIDTVAVPERHVETARNAVAKAERQFILDRLREL